MHDLNKLYCADCMEAMRDIPDGFFEWAFVDPPYGIGVNTMSYTNGDTRKRGAARANRRNYSGSFRDVVPDERYFNELFRVSRNQVIWGANYFTTLLPTMKTYVVWDKRGRDGMVNGFSDCEIAWTSTGSIRIFRFLWNGMLQQDMKNKEERFHPTQKPTALYEWLLKTFANPGDKILDTHAGSASSIVACVRRGFDWMGFKIDEGYHGMAQARIERAREEREAELAQMRIEGI